jgi:hypothetical protein
MELTMGNKRRLGLIVDREQLCSAMGVSDSTITDWEKKDMPTVRRGRGRGMKSLYDLDAVRAWCARTGYGHTTQALLASFSRTEPAPAAAAPPVQTSAPLPASVGARCAYAGQAGLAGGPCSALARLDFRDRVEEVQTISPLSWTLGALSSLLRAAGVTDEELIARVNELVVDRLRTEGMAAADLAAWRAVLEHGRIGEE